MQFIDRTKISVKAGEERENQLFAVRSSSRKADPPAATVVAVRISFSLLTAI